MSAHRRGSAVLIAMAMAVAFLCTLIMPGASTGSAAYWNDKAEVTASSVKLGPLPVAPKQASGTGLNCLPNNSSSPKTITFSWASTSGPAGIPQNYSAKAYVKTSANGARNELPVVVSTQSGQNNLMVQLNNSSTGGLIKLLVDLLVSLLGSKSYIEIEVTAHYSSALHWTSTTMHTTATYETFLLGLNPKFSCV